MSAMQIPADRAATAHMSFFMLVFLFVSLPQHCAVRTDEECGVRSAECGVRSAETEVLHRTLTPSFLISLRSYILLITLRFVLRNYTNGHSTIQSHGLYCTTIR